MATKVSKQLVELDHFYKDEDYHGRFARDVSQASPRVLTARSITSCVKSQVLQQLKKVFPWKEQSRGYDFVLDEGHIFLSKTELEIFFGVNCMKLFPNHKPVDYLQQAAEGKYDEFLEFYAENREKARMIMCMLTLWYQSYLGYTHGAGSLTKSEVKWLMNNGCLPQVNLEEISEEGEADTVSKAYRAFAVAKAALQIIDTQGSQYTEEIASYVLKDYTYPKVLVNELLESIPSEDEIKSTEEVASLAACFNVD